MNLTKSHCIFRNNEKEDAEARGQRRQFVVQLRQAPKIIALAIKKCHGDKFGTNALCVQSWHKKKSSDKTAIMSQESREHALYRCTTNRTFDNTHWNATTTRFKVHIFLEGHKNMTEVLVFQKGKIKGYHDKTGLRLGSKISAQFGIW